MTAVFYYIIYNPAAGGGSSIPIYKQVKAVLDQRHLAYAIKTSRYPGHTNVITKQIGDFNRREHPVLLVIGGDGTLNQAINGLAGTRQYERFLLLTYQPDRVMISLAVSVCLKIRCMRWNKYLQATEAVTIDIGRFHERTRGESGYFVNNIGIGFDAAVVNAANRQMIVKQLLNRLHLGKLTYLFHVVGLSHDSAIPSRLPSMKKAFAIFFIAPISAPPPTFLILAVAFVFTNRLTQPTGNLIS